MCTGLWGIENLYASLLIFGDLYMTTCCSQVTHIQLEQISHIFQIGFLFFVLFHAVIGFRGPQQITMPETEVSELVTVEIVKGDFPSDFTYILGVTAVDGTAGMLSFSL